MERALPLFVLAAMRSVNDPYAPLTWRFILTAAHELAGAREEFDEYALQAIDSIGICARWKDFFLSHSAVVRMRQQRMDGAPAKWRNADCEVTSHILTLT